MDTRKRLGLAGLCIGLLLAACTGGGVSGRNVPGSASDFDPGAPLAVVPGAGNQSKGGSSVDPSRSGAAMVEPATPPMAHGPIAGSSTPIFTPAEDRIGITDSTIRLCMPAPWTYMRLLGVEGPEDLTVYLTMRNRTNKVIGRDVIVDWPDDMDDDAKTKEALQKCLESKPFFTVPATMDVRRVDQERQWAEDTHTLLYFAHSTEADKFTYSYSGYVSIEAIGRFGAEWILHAHPGKRIGLVYRNDKSYEPGMRSFEATLAARGVPIAKKVAVESTRDQGQYSSQILALDGAADVVFVLEDLLGSTNFLRQASAANYRPQWVLMTAVNLTTDTLGRDAVHPHPIESFTQWPVYRMGDYSGRWGREVKRFEETYERYRGHANASEVNWVGWILFRAFAKLFEKCGVDCTRNKLVSIRRWPVDTFCPIRFRPGSNFGGNTISVVRAYETSPGLAAWKQIPGQICKSHF